MKSLRGTLLAWLLGAVLLADPATLRAMTTISMRHHTSANAGSEISFPRIAVKPQMTTQK